MKADKSFLATAGVIAAASLILSGCMTAGGACGREPDAANVRLAAIFADHGVLQRDRPIPVWGWAEPGGAVAVSIDGGKAYTAVAGDDGRWSVTLPALKADGGRAHTLTVAGRETISVTDLLVGDVWLCSGQSNMAFTLGAANTADEAIANADMPMLRHFRVRNVVHPVPAEDVSGSWEVSSAKTIPGWTAVGFFFGRELQRHLDIPIGLINSSVGGTRVEAWTSREAYARLPGSEGDLNQLAALGDNFDEMLRRYEESTRGYMEEYRKFEALDSDEAHQAEWADPALDDSEWKPIEIGVNVEEAGYPGFDGEFWYRRAVEIPEAWAGRALRLDLGPIDEVDTAFFNGVRVDGRGSIKPLETRFWNVPREYVVPAGLVKAGRAVIAVRVADQSGQCGMWGRGTELLRLAPADALDDPSAISLAEGWVGKVAFQLPTRPGQPSDPNTATVLFNGMINGLIPYPIKGAIWYQGESNAGNAWVYRERFAAMIKDWRARWGEGDFPFLWVQLANFMAPLAEPRDTNWAVVRDSQNATLALPNTATAVIIDIGEEKDIHPRNKVDVGRRLALGAYKVAYGENIVHSGPTYAGMAVEDGAIRVRFDNVGGGLVAKGGDLKRFAIAGADGKFVWADASIDGSTVVVRAEGVAEPVAVRYAWEDNPEGCNLYNAEGLPASPFRTDDWKLNTQPRR